MFRGIDTVPLNIPHIQPEWWNITSVAENIVKNVNSGVLHEFCYVVFLCIQFS